MPMILVLICLVQLVLLGMLWCIQPDYDLWAASHGRGGAQTGPTGAMGLPGVLRRRWPVYEWRN